VWTYRTAAKCGMILAASAVLLYVCGSLSSSIAGGNQQSALMIGVGFVAFFVAGRIAGNWQSGVYFFLVWLVFEDMIRKYWETACTSILPRTCWWA